MNSTLVATLLAKANEQKPRASSREDDMVLFLHFILQQECGFSLTHVLEEEVQVSSAFLPENWNKVPNFYSYRYKREGKCFHFRAIVIDSTVIVYFSEVKSNEIRSFERNLQEYFPSTPTPDGWGLLGDEFLNYVKEITGEIKGNKEEVKKEKKNSLRIDSDYDSPLRDPNSPYRNTHPFADPYSGEHPGMEIGPNHPMFGDDPLRMNQPRKPKFPGGMPHARFDPFGPRPGFNQGPNPDHMGFPPDSMFM